MAQAILEASIKFVERRGINEVSSLWVRNEVGRFEECMVVFKLPSGKGEKQIMKHTLQFLNPIWHRGANVTIRRGSKWFDKAQKGDEVEIVRTGEEPTVIARGIIDVVSYHNFQDVAIQDLWEELDPECRTPDGLVRAMLMAYPDFTLDDKVSVVRFIID